MKESSDMEKKGMRRGNPPLSATSVYPSESDKYKGKDKWVVTVVSETG